MRRGSKTAEMLLLNDVQIECIQQDFSSGNVSEPLVSDYNEAVELAAAAAAAASRQAAYSVDSSAAQSCTRNWHHRRSSSSSSSLFHGDLEKNAAPRRMSVMTALKVNFESTSLSPAPFRRRMSWDVLM